MSSEIVLRYPATLTGHSVSGNVVGGTRSCKVMSEGLAAPDPACTMKDVGVKLTIRDGQVPAHDRRFGARLGFRLANFRLRFRRLTGDAVEHFGTAGARA